MPIRPDSKLKFPWIFGKVYRVIFSGFDGISGCSSRCGSDCREKFRTIIGGMQVDIVVFGGFPEPVNPDVVKGFYFAVHGYQIFEMVLYISGPFDAGVLATLIGVYDLGLSIPSYGIRERLYEPRCFHGVADA
ncbi:hypothetical protein, partial [Umezakia ovalisporum]|uniref:hypothetical protein n=1 Tax=Umezakia ovalisporum TaxID=75695 RepID=UPI0039C75662